MIENFEGFFYPQIDDDKCVDCGICLKHCHLLNRKVIKNKMYNYPIVYAVKNKDKEILKQSSSGGMFTVVANNILEKNGMVFGVAFDENLIAKHVCINSKDDLKNLRGSKYVESDTNNTFKKVKELLNNNTCVLYTGCPCQIAGLKVFLGKEYDNLTTIDLICHGVPSQKIFLKYIDWKEKKIGNKILSYEFRSKIRGWGLNYKITTEKKVKKGIGELDPYYYAFLNGLIYRESCYKCKYANIQRCGDITLADFWGVEKLHPRFYSNKGVSLVLINSNNGKRIFDEIIKDIEYMDSTIENAVLMNGNLEEPSKRPKIRNEIYIKFNNYEFEQFLKKYLEPKNKVKGIVKTIIPNRLKIIVRRIKR